MVFYEHKQRNNIPLQKTIPAHRLNLSPKQDLSNTVTDISQRGHVCKAHSWLTLVCLGEGDVKGSQFGKWVLHWGTFLYPFATPRLSLRTGILIRTCTVEFLQELGLQEMLLQQGRLSAIWCCSRLKNSNNLCKNNREPLTFHSDQGFS